MTFADFSFSGILSGRSISGILNWQGTNYDAHFDESTFHFTNFYPGQTLQTTIPKFSWTASAGATKYWIEVQQDNAQHDCNETSSCITVWPQNYITGTTVTFNANGQANALLIHEKYYRVVVKSLNDASVEIDNSTDIAFQVMN